MIRKKGDERFVRLPIDRARSEAHFDATAVMAGELGVRRARLDVQLEDHSDATAGRRFQSTISTTWIRITSTSGVRSNWPTGGM